MQPTEQNSGYPLREGLGQQSINPGIFLEQQKRKNVLHIGIKSLQKIQKIKQQSQNIQEITDQELKFISSLDQLQQDELLNLSIKILKKDKKNRSRKDILMLQKCTANVKFFQDLTAENGPETHLNMCKVMGLKRQLKDDIVFRHGDYGSLFYIILKGSVGVIVPIPVQRKPRRFQSGSDLDTDGLSLSGSANSGTPLMSGRSMVSGLQSPQESQPTRRLPTEEQFEWTEVKVLQAGSSFGELALIQYAARSATIKCKENCTFIILSKKNFNEILREIENQKFTYEFRFYQSISVFQGWSFQEIKALALIGKKINYMKHHVVYKEGEPTDFVYIIRSGEFHLVQSTTVQYDPTDPSNFLLQEVLKEPSTKKNVSQTFKYKVAALCAGEIAGEYEYVFKLKNREHTLECFSYEGQLVRYTKKEFYDRIYCKYNIANYFKKRLVDSKRFRDDRLTEFKKSALNSLIQNKISVSGPVKRLLSQLMQEQLAAGVPLDQLKSLRNMEYYLKTNSSNSKEGDNNEGQSQASKTDKFKKSLTLDSLISSPNYDGTEDMPLEVINEFSKLIYDPPQKLEVDRINEYQKRKNAKKEQVGAKIGTYKFTQSTKDRRPTVTFIGKDKIQLISTTGDEMNLLRKFEDQYQVPNCTIKESYEEENLKKSAKIKKMRELNAKMMLKNSMESDVKRKQVMRHRTPEQYCKHIAMQKLQRVTSLQYQINSQEDKIKLSPAKYKQCLNTTNNKRETKSNNNIVVNQEEDEQIQIDIIENKNEEDQSLNNESEDKYGDGSYFMQKIKSQIYNKAKEKNNYQVLDYKQKSILEEDSQLEQNLTSTQNYDIQNRVVSNENAENADSQLLTKQRHEIDEQLKMEDLKDISQLRFLQAQAKVQQDSIILKNEERIFKQRLNNEFAIKQTEFAKDYYKPQSQNQLKKQNQIPIVNNSQNDIRDTSSQALQIIYPNQDTFIRSQRKRSFEVADKQFIAETQRRALSISPSSFRYKKLTSKQLQQVVGPSQQDFLLKKIEKQQNLIQNKMFSQIQQIERSRSVGAFTMKLSRNQFHVHRQQIADNQKSLLRQKAKPELSIFGDDQPTTTAQANAKININYNHPLSQPDSVFQQLNSTKYSCSDSRTKQMSLSMSSKKNQHINLKNNSRMLSSHYGPPFHNFQQIIGNTYKRNAVSQGKCINNTNNNNITNTINNNQESKIQLQNYNVPILHQTAQNFQNRRNEEFIKNDSSFTDRPSINIILSNKSLQVCNVGPSNVVASKSSNLFTQNKKMIKIQMEIKKQQINLANKNHIC